MPTRAPRRCTATGCGNQATHDGKCNGCAKRASRYEEPPGASTQRARPYNREWRRIRADYLAAHPTCEANGCARDAIDVHHIDGHGPTGDNSWANLQALCKPHHSYQTAKFDGGFGRARKTGSH